MAIQISIRESGDITILDLEGRATISDGESELLRSKLEELMANGVQKCLLNLADMSHVDSSGFSVIVNVCLSRQGRRLEAHTTGRPCVAGVQRPTPSRPDPHLRQRERGPGQLPTQGLLR